MRDLVVWMTYGAVALMSWIFTRYVYRAEMQALLNRRALRLAPVYALSATSTSPRRGADGRFVTKGQS